MATAPPQTKAYLLKNRGNSWWVNVELQLTDTNLRCVASEYSKWVDEELGLTDYKAKLSSGEPVVVFDFRRDQLTIKWLRQFYRGGFRVSQGDSREWLVSLVYPSGFGSLLDLMTDRALWRQWRAALPDTPGHA
ncbi:hypothetical protein [Mycobacterium sp. SP-6446]|uniref:hypothetical protein n=1 Tax=Mycobacterium sp. SP-6446 TaxID=1834162 RepID=UPI00096E8B19|nr:hypothetical protein [Mycobacterium sp. SP-6446]OMC13604.1 hypothetical protein A5736_22755 [Mycobacterium sp. SP-6446]